MGADSYDALRLMTERLEVLEGFWKGQSNPPGLAVDKQTLW